MRFEEFDDWMDAMLLDRGWTWRQCAKELGVGVNQPARWRREGAPAHIGYACSALARGYGLPPRWDRLELPRYIGLACAALDNGLPVWKAPKPR